MTIQRTFMPSVVAVFFSAWAAMGMAQAPPTLESLDQRTGDIESRLTTIEASLTNISKQLNQLLTTPTDAPPLGDAASLEERIRVLEEGFSELTTIVGQIARMGSDEVYSPNILSKMSESGEFRSEVAKAIQGKLRFRNYTGTEQVLYINGSPWRVLAGESYLWVPYGVVTTAQSPADRPMEANDWSFNGANPEMMVTIGQ